MNVLYCNSIHKETEADWGKEMTRNKLLRKWRSLPMTTNLSAGRSLHHGPDTVDELLDRHVAKKENKLVDDDEEDLVKRRRIATTRREALSLYRDILRATRFFTWGDARGVPWRDVLRDNARKEFEAARLETDPEIVTRLLIGGRDAVDSALEKLVDKQRQQLHKERRGGGDRSGKDK